MLSGSGRWSSASAVFVMAILAVLTITAAGCGGQSGGEVPDVPVTPTVLRPAATGPPSTPEKKAPTPSVPAVSLPSPSPRREAVSSPSPASETAAPAAPAATMACGGGTVADCRADASGNRSIGAYSGSRGYGIRSPRFAFRRPSRGSRRRSIRSGLDLRRRS